VEHGLDTHLQHKYIYGNAVLTRSTKDMSKDTISFPIAQNIPTFEIFRQNFLALKLMNFT
jgi:hypothetical protein